MSLNSRAHQSALASHASSTGHFDSTIPTHEPKNAPGSGLSCAIWFTTVAPATSGLNTTSALVIYTAQIRQNMLAEPQDDIDADMLDALDALFTAYIGDIDLGGQVRNIDVRGIHGTPLSAEAGYVNQDSKLYRAINITVPLVVNDVWAEAP